MKNALSASEKERVKHAVLTAEKETSGEIRVHIDQTCPGDPLDRAIELFQQLGMEATQYRNAALIYLSLKDHKGAIVGDTALNEVVPQHFWDDECALMISHFKRGKIADGLCAGVLEVGKELARYFPLTADSKNELSNDLSYGNE